MDIKEIKGLNVKKLSTKLIIVELILFLVSVFVSIQVYESHEVVDKITDEYTQIQSEIYIIQTHSDYQTGKARQFVRTSELIFAEEYIQEMKNCGADKDDIADEFFVGKEAIEHIKEARVKSATLHNREKQAMTLVAYDSIDEEISSLNFGYTLSENEKNLSPEERLEKADSLVFGDGYANERDSFRNSVELANDDLLGGVADYRAKRNLIYRVAFIVLVVLLVASLNVFLVIAYCLFKFVLRPLDESIKAIKDNEEIPFSNSYELNYLASIYNKVHEENVKTRIYLKSKAEKDALTGLLNRETFNSLTNIFKESGESISLLIIDVDNFKTINDTYGHKTGDTALVKVASILKQSFRSDDFIIRYGGDEFIVVMSELDEEAQKAIIERKLIHINEVLQNPTEDGLPKLSVSVGVAFSKKGFEDDLFERADKALYKTKENGRCGYTFAD